MVLDSAYLVKEGSFGIFCVFYRRFRFSKKHIWPNLFQTSTSKWKVIITTFTLETRNWMHRLNEKMSFNHVPLQHRSFGQAGKTLNTKSLYGKQMKLKFLGFECLLVFFQKNYRHLFFNLETKPKRALSVPNLTISTTFLPKSCFFFSV